MMKRYGKRTAYLMVLAVIFALAAIGCSAAATVPVEKFGGKGTFQTVQLS